MICEKCNTQVVEGNFVYLPMTKQTMQGIMSTFMHVILCDSCNKTIPNPIVGSAKCVEAEIVT